MHLFIATEGDGIYTDRFIQELRATYVDAPTPKQIKQELKKKGIDNPSILQQIQVREIKMWDVVFPKDALNVTMQRIAPFGSPDSSIEKFINLILKPIRSLLRLKPVDYKKHKQQATGLMIKNGIRYPPIMHPFVRVFPIGIKEDYTSESQEVEAL